MTATITTPISWTDSPRCTCGEQDCPRVHGGDDLLDDRFALVVKDDAVYVTDLIESFVIDLTDQHAEEPFTPGEARVRDLATGAEMDARAFVLEFA